MIPGEADTSQKSRARSPLAQLLHALNQPLTGLQCSMEVALASPRSTEQYMHGLREGLQLTERMRALVEAIREVVDIQTETEEEKNREAETVELNGLLREAVEDITPVAGVKKVRVGLGFPPESSLQAGILQARTLQVRIKIERVQLTAVIFQLLDSILSLVARGSVLRIEAGSETPETPEAPEAPETKYVWMRIQWQADGQRSAFSRPELGLLVVQARLERSGAQWGREGADGLETLTVRLPGASSAALSASASS